MRDKLKVLFLAADPFREGARLELGEEARAIERAVQRGSARGGVELVAHFATRLDDVRDALLRHEPQVVHFAGRGAPASIRLADEDGQPRPVGREALRGLFGGPGGSVRVAVLNGCDTPGTVEALAEVVDYTIGMNGRTVGSAVAFADAFYSALAMGCTVLTAFELGLSQLELEGSPEAPPPMRRIRRGVDLDATLVPRPGGGGVYAGQARGPLLRHAVRIADSGADARLPNGGGAAGPGGQPAEPRNRTGRAKGRDVRFGGG